MTAHETHTEPTSEQLEERLHALLAQATGFAGADGQVEAVGGTALPVQIARLLSDGYTNRNHLVRVGERELVLRLGNPDATRLGIERVREQHIWRAAANAGLSPALLAFDAARGDAVSVFVPVPSAAEFAAGGGTIAVERLARLLRRTHALNVAATAVDPADAVRRYIAIRLDAGLDWPDWTATHLAAVSARTQPTHPTLTHHDFNPWNLLLDDAGADLVLDWEYAGAGDPLFDLVTVFAHWQLDAGDRARLLAAYGIAAADTAALSQRLGLLECLFHLREFTWAGAMLALGNTNPSVLEQWEREADWLRVWHAPH